MDELLLADTDVMVDFLRGHPKAVAFLNRNADRIVLSSITVAELYAGVRGEAEQEAIDAVIGVLRVAAVTGQCAKVGGLLKQRFGKSHGVGLADAIIAATAQIEHARLCTLNVRHYPMVVGMKAAYTKA